MSRTRDMIPVPRSILLRIIEELRYASEAGEEHDATQAIDDWIVRYDDPGVISEPY